MNAQKAEDVKDIALKLNEIKVHCPEEYFYIKGWIHCLLLKESRMGGQTGKHPVKTYACGGKQVKHGGNKL